MPFLQEPPSAGDPYAGDRALRSCLARILPRDVHAAIEPELRAMGELAGGRLRALQERHRDAEPRLTNWDPWGDRVDTIELTPLWQEAARVAAEWGVVATAYERR